jgi:hypothetical protein
LCRDNREIVRAGLLFVLYETWQEDDPVRRDCLILDGWEIGKGTVAPPITGSFFTPSETGHNPEEC